MKAKEDSPLIECPVCGKASDSLACTARIKLLFLFVWARVTTQRVICCPECRRRILKENLFGWNILRANIMWPFWAILETLLVLPFSYVKGHSWYVRKIIKSQNS